MCSRHAGGFRARAGDSCRRMSVRRLRQSTPLPWPPGVHLFHYHLVTSKVRLVELVRGAVNVVVQPGHWDVPRIDHLGVALDDDGFLAALERASDLELKIQDHPGKRTFIATEAGYRLEVHPPREWIEELLDASGELRLAQLHLRADDPRAKAAALAELFELERVDAEVMVGETLVRFVPGGPDGRPELVGEVFA